MSTGCRFQLDAERMRQAGFDHLLTKPADPKVLYSLLDSLEQEGE